jgi:hypothetical protein
MHHRWVFTILNLGTPSSAFGNGPGVGVCSGCRDQVVDITRVHQVGTGLVQRGDPDVPHGRLQLILHDCGEKQKVSLESQGPTS